MPRLYPSKFIGPPGYIPFMAADLLELVLSLKKEVASIEVEVAYRDSVHPEQADRFSKSSERVLNALLSLGRACEVPPSVESYEGEYEWVKDCIEKKLELVV